VTYPSFSNKTAWTAFPPAWDVFTFVVANYNPSYQWAFQAHEGDKWDTFSGLDFSTCPCPNCDGGIASRYISSCTLPYPVASSSGRPGAIFNENECLYNFAISGSFLQMFYTDEHALSLGISEVVFPNGTTQKFEVEPFDFNNDSPRCVLNPKIGNLDFKSSSPLSNVDVNKCAGDVDCGRPLPPMLYITDITVNTDQTHDDWQFHGKEYPPYKLCGSWKSVRKTINADGTFTVDPEFAKPIDPVVKNINSGVWNLGAGSDPAPKSGYNGAAPQAYGAEIVWDIDLLGLDASHTYKFQFLVHDGDQNKGGGDVGEACIIASAACPAAFTGPQCSQCEVTPKPAGYVWLCTVTGDPSDPWQLVKVPKDKTSQFPSSFSPFDSNGNPIVDQDGFQLRCDCSRVKHDCSDNMFCCGGGTCNEATNICKCDAGNDGPTCCPPVETTLPGTTTTAPPVTTTSISTSTTSPGATVPETFPPPPPGFPPCYNTGLFCSGHGTCDHGQCQCHSTDKITYSGAACQDAVAVGDTCSAYNDCSGCTSTADSLDCTWCGDVVGGGCLPTSAGCLSPITSCSGVIAIAFVPEPCPDECGGPKAGVCINISCAATPEPHTQPCINTSANQTAAFCLCKKGRHGLNCGGGKSLAKALAISGGVIAAIVICGVIIIVIIAFGAKKGVDWAMMSHHRNADFQSNPIATERDSEHFSGIHQ